MPAGCWGSGEERNATSRWFAPIEETLTQAIIALASKYGRYGYRRISALLGDAGRPIGIPWQETNWANT